MRAKSVIAMVLIALMTTALAVPGGVQASEKKMITQKPKMKMTTPIPENLTTPDKVQTSIGTLEFFDGVPIVKTSPNEF